MSDDLANLDALERIEQGLEPEPVEPAKPDDVETQARYRGPVPLVQLPIPTGQTMGVDR